MSITVELPADLAAKVSRLARERGVNEAAIVTEFTREGLKPIDSLEPLPDNPEDIEPFKIYRNPISGLPNMSIGRPITMEELDQFFEEEANDQLPD